MTGKPPPSDHDRLSAEAALWCTRMHDQDCSVEDRRDFVRWLAEDPRHRAEYDAMLSIWQLAENLKQPNPSAAASSTVAHIHPPIRPRGRHRLGRVAAAAAVLVVAVGTLWSAGWSVGMLPSRIGYYAAENAPRKVELADHSQVQLNSHTRLIFASYRDRRSAWLNGGGEAFFEVRHDRSQPFTVHTDNGQVRVTGTRFNVWTNPQQLLVTLLDGSVTVSPPEGVSGNSAQLMPGMQARYSQVSRRIEVEQVTPAGAIAWIQGKLVLDDLPLSSALPLINRYLEKPVRLGDDEAGAMRIGGVYQTNDLRALIDSLPVVLPIELTQRGDSTVLMSRKKAL
ncbi:FecR family protein [Stutzerimonas stutzeri]|uniref:FecR family protein n=1 Tax=Stutzerimonas stutzeri TaxID=316 RepID=UPI001C2E5984|nr:FecR family protein [Stutzerimonas stutzeri]